MRQRAQLPEDLVARLPENAPALVSTSWAWAGKAKRNTAFSTVAPVKLV